MQYLTASVAVLAVTAAASATAEPVAPAQPVAPTASISAGPAVDEDAAFGASVTARAGAAMALGTRTRFGGFAEVAAATWEGGDGALFAGIGPAVRVRLTDRLAIEPAVTFAAERRAGETSPSYGSTVALVVGALRGGVSSRMFFDRDRSTELHAFVGWQLE